jgi:tetratricopeptide (TPR) repeat protein
MHSSQILPQVIQKLKNGNPAEAEMLCSRLISNGSANSDVHYLLGVARERQGRFDGALSAYRQACALNPGATDAWLACGAILMRFSHHQDALDCYDRILAGNKRSVRAWNGRALILHKMNRTPEAMECFSRALHIEPSYVAGLCNRGTMRMEQGEFEQALADFDLALKFQPKYVQALNGRGNALRGLGRLTDALGAYDTLLENFPNSVPAHSNRAIVLRQLGRFDEGLRSLDAAIKLQPGSAEVWNNRGNLLYETGNLEEALSSYDSAIRIDEKYAEAWNNKGRTLRRIGHLDEAVAAYDRAIALAPHLAEASVNKALCLLLMGKFEQGLLLYEARRKTLPAMLAQSGAARHWAGENLDGKRIILCAEQGLGDTIQFARYAKILEDRGAIVMLAVPARLVRSLRGLAANVRVMDQDGPMPEADFYIRLMSLPFACGTTLGTVPASTNYLSPEKTLVEAWRHRLRGEGFKIGIHWQGNRQAIDDQLRSIPLNYFGVFSDIEGVRLISLQKGEGLDQISRAPWAAKLEELGDPFDWPDAFVDSAAVISNLDLVITSDSAIAHLAGALGRKVWLALPHSADWRWLTMRSDSPWYPTMRIFRQPSAGDWEAVFLRMLQELRHQDRMEGGVRSTDVR